MLPQAMFHKSCSIFAQNMLRKRAVFLGEVFQFSITPKWMSSSGTNYDFGQTIMCDSLEIHAIWLRHHCQCDQCFNKITHQRMKIPSHLPSVASVMNSKLTENNFHICWNDGHESNFQVSWLKKHAPKDSKSQKLSKEGFPYYVSRMKESCSDTTNRLSNPKMSAISFEDFMKPGDDGVSHLLQNVIRHGYGIVEECPPDFETTKKVIAKVSHPQNTIFGDFSEWTSNLAHADTAYTNDFVHLHTDTSYFTEPVGLQIFHCLKHEGTGGINFLVDGFEIADKMAQTNREYYRQLSSANVPSQYIDSGKHHFYSNDVIFGHERFSGRIQKVRYNPHDMAVLAELPFDNVAKFYESLVHFSNLLESNPQKIKLVPGTVIFLDNWRTLHGRSSFTGFRHLCGAYISRSDWVSRARVVGALL